jgi:uncharacterized protein YceH (UPF0502 family)
MLSGFRLLRKQAMHPPLSHVEVRVLGALIEKAATTPDTYPLTVSALVAACNQLTNREPVMQLDEDAVGTAIVTLRRRSLLRAIQPAGSRVTKYLHLLDDALELDTRELALLGVLMLRGPQTIGELNTRTSRLAVFSGIDDVEQLLEQLVTRNSGSLVVRLPRRAGQKEARFAHLLAGEVIETGEPNMPLPVDAKLANVVEPDASLLLRIVALESEMAALRADLAAFKAQFG